MRVVHVLPPADRVILHPGQRRDAVAEIIGAARSRLSLSIYRLDDEGVIADLIRARRRGVAVEVLATRRVKRARRPLREVVARLRAEGLHVRRYADLTRYHAKYLIADDRLALVGSLNLTRKCFEETCDLAVLTRDREVVGGLRRLFEVDFFGAKAPRDGDYGPRLVVAPDVARARLSTLIESARTSIRILDHKLTDGSMLSLLRARAQARVAIELLGRDEVAPLSAHGKLLIVDGRQAALGSIALSAKSLDRRRELAIVVRDRTAVNALEDYVDRLTRPAAEAAAVPAWLKARAV